MQQEQQQQTLPPELWLEKVATHLNPRDLVRLLAVDHAFRNTKQHHLNERDILRVVGRNPRCDNLIKVKEIENLMEVPKLFVPFVHLQIFNGDKTLDANKWTGEQVELAELVGQMTVFRGKSDGLDRLGKLKRLDLFMNNITSIPQLESLEYVSLFDCCGVGDVSSLNHVGDVTIQACSGVTDLASLGGLRQSQLTLSSCWLYHLSPFADVHTLNIVNCGNVTDLSALTKTHTLKITNCPKVTDVSPLANSHTLQISKCGALTDISVLTNVHTLEISYCPAITDAAGLNKTHIHTLDIGHCYGVTDLSMLSHINTLIVGEKGRKCSKHTTVLEQHGVNIVRQPCNFLVCK